MMLVAMVLSMDSWDASAQLQNNEIKSKEADAGGKIKG